jgi:hypothetical protein
MNEKNTIKNALKWVENKRDENYHNEIFRAKYFGDRNP